MDDLRIDFAALGVITLFVIASDSRAMWEDKRNTSLFKRPATDAIAPAFRFFRSKKRAIRRAGLLLIWFGFAGTYHFRGVSSTWPFLLSLGISSIGIVLYALSDFWLFFAKHRK